MNFRALVVSSILLFALGCAEGTTNTDDNEGDTANDLAEDGAEDGGEDVTPDLPGDVPGDPGGDTQVCTPNETRCNAASDAVETCSTDGSGWDSDTCGATEVCEEGACKQMMICEPDSALCTDYQTLTRCSAGGTSEIPMSCEPGRCIDASCTTGTKDTGEPCTTAEECAGASCQCSDNQCPGTPLENGYCTTSQCDEHGCAPSEVCVNFGLGSRTNPQDCILDCTDCTDAGFACRELPEGSGADLVWKSACYQSDFPRDVGQPCTSDDECIGGLCLTDSPNGAAIDMGYCSAPCETQSNCPSNAACITVADYLNDGGFCALSCIDVNGSQECPPERPSTFELDCIIRAASDGGPPERVCFQL